MSPRAPALDTSVRVFAALLAARAAFGLTYLAAAVGGLPVPWYYPLAHAWQLTTRPAPYAMGWFGLTAIAAVAAVGVGGVTYAVTAVRRVARGLARPSVVLALARAGGLVLLVDFVYFGWALTHDERRPWPAPACADRGP